MTPKLRLFKPHSLFLVASSASLLASSAAGVSKSGWLALDGDQTISTYSLDGSVLTGSGTLTVTDGATLNGGTVYAGLAGDITSSDEVSVGGHLSGASLVVASGTLTLEGLGHLFFPQNGSISSAQTTVAAGATLLTYSIKGFGHNMDLINSGTLTLEGYHDRFTRFDESVATYTQNPDGLLNGYESLIAIDHATLNGGIVGGTLISKSITSTGNVRVFGTIGGEELSVTSGTLLSTGILNSKLVDISHGATLIDSSFMNPKSHVINAGTLTEEYEELIGHLTNNGGAVNGNGLLAVSGTTIFNGGRLDGTLWSLGGASLNDGTRVTGNLQGITTTNGRVEISGIQDRGDLHVSTGTLTLTGTAGSNTTVGAGATLRGNGQINGSLANEGTIKIDGLGDKALKINGSLVTHGSIELSLHNRTDCERISVGGTARLNGNLVVTNTGTGLAAGEIAKLLAAGSYEGRFTNFDAIGFENSLLFDNATGRLIGMADGEANPSKTYLNLNRSQTSVYLALYEDSVEPAQQNVFIGSGSSAKQRAPRAATAPVEQGAIHFTSGLSNGDPQLVAALSLATFTSPGTIFQPVINLLSPEVHRGMADYTEQATRSHVEAAVDAAPVSRTGKTQIFGTLHSTTDSVDSSTTAAGYDLDIYGVTSGVRYEIDKRFQIGGLLGVDDGHIQGPLIDTDAQGLVVGTFGRYLADEASQTMVTASLSYGCFDYNSKRHSFGGDARADDIGSDSLEFAVGARTVAFQKQGFRVIPKETLRHLTGSVDRFTEYGPGVDLRVGSQDIDTLLLDLGVDFEYQLQKQITLTGSVGYIHDFMNSDQSVSGHFAASGPLGTPFSVSAPGIDDDALILGLGAFNDINDRIRVGLTYRGEFHTDSEYSHSIGAGASFGF